ncbi:MAG: hypothetical protein PUD91_05480 [Bacteroidales bacterium]|nr:hypothetical protein [Bacteroidales bacterium]
MKKYIIMLSVAAAMLATSCSTIEKTATTRAITAPVAAAVTADLEVSPNKITYTYYPTSAVRRGGMQNIKAAAVAEALARNGNADVLIEPQTEIVQKKGFFGGFKVKSITVTGYPATYKNFRQVSTPTLEQMMLGGRCNKPCKKGKCVLF